MGFPLSNLMFLSFAKYENNVKYGKQYLVGEILS